jgi:hypothetical protein
MDPVAILTTATADLGDNLSGVAALGLAVGVGLFALRKGWKLLKGFTS